MKPLSHSCRIQIGRIALASLLFTTPGECAEKESDWHQSFQEVSAHARQGYDPVIESRLRDLERQAPTPERRIEASIALAAFLAQETERRQREVDQLYRDILQQASSGKIRLDARNSYGIRLLRQGRPGEAVAVLAAIEQDLEAVPDLSDANRARYLYNYAIALEQVDRVERALLFYLKASHLSPNFRPATDGTFRLARMSMPLRPRLDGTHGNTSVISDLIETLLEHGEYDVARQYLVTLGLELTSNSSLRNEWFLMLAQYLAAAVPPQVFTADWGPLLATVRIGSPVWDMARIDLLEKAYSGEIPLLLDPKKARVFTMPWQGSVDQARAFSQLLEALGHAQRNAGDPESALASYSLAWSSAGNWHAAVYLAGLIEQAPTELDPNGQILKALVQTHNSGDFSPQSAEDWRNISRLHTLLAAAEPVPSDALVHWSQAVEAHQRWTALSSKHDPAPGLYASLGDALARVGRVDEARTYYLASADQYLSIERVEPALANLDRAKNIGKPVASEDPRIANLELQIASRALQRLSTDSELRIVSDSGSSVSLGTASGLAAFARVRRTPSHLVVQNQKIYRLAQPRVLNAFAEWRDRYLLQLDLGVEPDQPHSERAQQMWMHLTLDNEGAQIVGVDAIPGYSAEQATNEGLAVHPVMYSVGPDQKSFSSLYSASSQSGAPEAQRFFVLLEVPEGVEKLPTTITFSSGADCTPYSAWKACTFSSINKNQLTLELETNETQDFSAGQAATPTAAPLSQNPPD